jgi:hypothetical protein
MPCDQCSAYHSLGYDSCPACQFAPEEPLPPATPLALLVSLEDAMRHALLDGGRVEDYQVAVWIALVKSARERLQESNTPGETDEQRCPICNTVRQLPHDEDAWTLHVNHCLTQVEEDAEWTAEVTLARRDAWDAWVISHTETITSVQLAAHCLRLGWDLPTLKRHMKRHQL